MSVSGAAGARAQVLTTVETEDPGPVSEGHSLLLEQPNFVYTSRYVSLEQIFILVSHRREQNEAISLAGVCVSASYSAYIHHCGQLYVYVYMCIVYMCLCCDYTLSPSPESLLLGV